MAENIHDPEINFSEWNPPKNWLKVKTIDVHTAGEPLRIIFDGLPEIKGRTILEKRKYMKENFDHFRKALMFEPRGHADMYGAIITEPERKNSDFGALFLHNEGYSTMCGHGIIALTKVAVQTEIVKINEPITQIKIDTPAGMVTSFAKVQRGKAESVRFHNVPSFVLAKNQQVEVKGIGKVNYDIAFGGAFYTFVDADKLGIRMKIENFRELIEKGMEIKNAVSKSYPVKHPFEKDLDFLYGTIFFGRSLSKEANSRNVCIFAEGEVDRSPTGTGVSARMAVHYSKGELGLNQPMIVESIIGTSFTGSIYSKTKFGEYDAVIPQVEGNAYITGKHEFLIDPEDPLKEGFILR
jgi:trans-L-3-hydroxyproline dehydratase